MEDSGLSKLGMAALSLLAGGAALYKRYHICKANEWLIRSGLLIKDVQVGKRFIQWPFQNIQVVDLTPKNYKINLNAMSQEKLPFVFPGSFTIGPKNDIEHIKNYGRYLLNLDTIPRDNLIKGILEGEVRGVASNTPIESIFSSREEFKKQISLGIDSQLLQYGIYVSNGNIEELQDIPGSDYFRVQSEKQQAQAKNTAKIEVAAQNQRGEIGAKEREATTRQKIAELESETIKVENENEERRLISLAKLNEVKAQQDYVAEKARIDASILRIQLEREVESKNLSTNLERQRADELSRILVDNEIKIKNAETEADTKMKLADAEFYQQRKLAEGKQINYEVDAEGLTKLLLSFNSNTRDFVIYQMIKSGTLEKLALSNADALKGMSPSLTVVGGSGKEVIENITNIASVIAPAVKNLENLSGYQLPEWLGKKVD